MYDFCTLSILGPIEYNVIKLKESRFLNYKELATTTKSSTDLSRLIEKFTMLDNMFISSLTSF